MDDSPRARNTAVLLAALLTATPSLLQAQQNDPKAPYNVAARFMEQTAESRAKIVQTCLIGLAGSSAAKALIDRATGAAVNAAARSAAWTSALVTAATAAACLYEWKQQLPKIRGAWRAMDAGARTLDAKVDVLRMLGAEELLLEGFLWAAGDLLVESADPDRYPGLNLKDVGEDLLRLREQCMAADDPNGSAACGAYFGDDIPQEAAVRLTFAAQGEISRCYYDAIRRPSDSDRPGLKLVTAMTSCQLFVEDRISKNQVTPVRVGAASFPNPYADRLQDVLDRKIALMNKRPQLVFVDDLVMRLAMRGPLEVYFVDVTGQYRRLGSANTLYHRGYNVSLNLTTEWDTASRLFGLPLGGVIDINGMKFRFSLLYDKNGALQRDTNGNWEYTLLTPDGQLFLGSSSGSSYQRQGVKLLKAFPKDQLVYAKIEFRPDGSALVRFGERAVEIGKDTGLFVLEGMSGRVNRDASGNAIAVSFYTPGGLEVYSLDASGRIATTVAADGSLQSHGWIVSWGGEEQRVDVVQKRDGTNVRTVKDAQGRQVSQTETSPSGWSVTDENGILTYKDKNGQVTHTRQCFEPGSPCIHCLAYDSRGMPRYCTDGEHSWDPGDAWGGDNPFSAERSGRPPDYCVGLPTCYAETLWYRLLFSGEPAGDTYTVERCHEENVQGRSTPDAFARLWNSWPCGGRDGIAWFSSILPDSTIELDPSVMTERPFRGDGMLITDTPEEYRLPSVPIEPDKGNVAYACDTTVANRQLIIQGFTPDSSIVDIEPACLTAISPFSIEFMFPHPLAPGTYRGELREASSGRRLKGFEAFTVQFTPSIAVVDPADWQPILRPGGWAAAFGQQLASTTAESTAPVEEVCAQDLGGRAVKVGAAFACLVYVSPTQINFQVPPDAGAGTFDMRLYDTSLATVENPYGKEIARSSKFVIVP